MNPFLATDGYKTGHHLMYPKGTTLVYSNFTPRSNKHANGIEKIVSFGQQMVMKQIHDMFDKEFFSQPKASAVVEIREAYTKYLGAPYNIDHIVALHDLGYLPIKVKSLPEGVTVQPGIPVLTIYNTKPEFFWLTNFLETLISTLLWKPMTSASIAYEYKKLLLGFIEKTDQASKEFVEFQAHDFSMRGMSGVESTISSGLGHATCFMGSDSLPVIEGARLYYGVQDKEVPVHSVNATEHSVMCAGGDENELDTFRYLMTQFPTGILSIVSDTWNLWDVCTKFLPELKDEILARDGKIVIRPDSGDPADIICGVPDLTEFAEDAYDEYMLYEFDYPKIFQYEGELFTCRADDLKDYYAEYGQQAELCMGDYVKCVGEAGLIGKGVIELLWETFGGTINEQGYKVLDSHIGCIYGDSITLPRAEDILSRLESKGYASSNVVLGIGSYTYQYNTRDTFGFAMKATYVEVDGVGREIFKDPITDDGTKKSAKGLLHVAYEAEEGIFDLTDKVSWHVEDTGMLCTIYEDGKFLREYDLDEIRSNINEEIRDGK